MFNIYGEDIEQIMSSIASGVNYDFIPADDAINYREENLVKPLRELLGRVKGRLNELNEKPISKLNSSRYEFATILYKLNKSMLWVYDVNNYNSFREWCKGELSVSTEFVTMYLKVAKFMLRFDKPFNIFDNQDYTISKLYSLSVIPVDELKDLANTHVISG